MSDKYICDCCGKEKDIDDIVSHSDYAIGICNDCYNKPEGGYNMKRDYDKWSREELLYEVKRLNSELEKVKQLKRLTDDRFVGDGFYQPKSKEERKEIQDMYKPSYKEIYDRLAEYERRFSNG